MIIPPVFRVGAADPFERRRAVGTLARQYVLRSLDLYSRVFEHYTGLKWEDVVPHAEAFRDLIESFAPHVMAEIEGLAHGAGVPTADVLALNVRSEIMFGLKSRPAGECTSFFCSPAASADGHVLVGQNWDWKPECASTTILVEADQGPDRPSYVTVVEAGLLAKTGFNSAGVGLATNTLISPADVGAPGVPYHVLLRTALDCTTAEEAADTITAAARSASANYMLADAAGHGISVETWPGSGKETARVEPAHGVIGHSNCFVCDVPFPDIGAVEIPDGPARVEELTARLTDAAGELSPAGLHRILSSHDSAHPGSICRHPDPDQKPIEQLCTVASCVVDLTAQRLHVCLGNPCRHDYEEYVPRFAAR